MKSGSGKLITVVTVLVVLMAAIFAVLRLGTPFSEAQPVPDGAGAFPASFLSEGTFLYVPGSLLKIRPAGYATQVEVGKYISFVVEKDGEFYSPSQVTYQIVSGKDCAAAYITGSVLGLGEGRVIVKVFLDSDPAVYGYCALNVVRGGASADMPTKADVSGAPAGDADFDKMIASFPESYKPYLRALHETYPAWRFYAVDTGVGFFDAVYNETSLDKNKVNYWNPADIFKRKTSGDYSFGEGRYYDAAYGWVYGNELFVSNYMDPRNFLDEQSIMQFESLRFNAGLHTVEGIESILAGSFMHQKDVGYYDTGGNLTADDKTHAQVLYEAGERFGVNPYFLAAKVRQEVSVGSQPSESVTGTFAGYEGYYNYFNIGAYDGMDEIQSGLRYAAGSGSYGRPWNTPEKAILGGAQFLSEEYISAGQDTGYMQKYNVSTSNTTGLYENQYMTNGAGAVDQGVKTYEGYARSGLLQEALEFYIPVFDDMPAHTKQAASLDLGGSDTGVATMTTALRAGPAVFYPQVEGARLSIGDIVGIRRCVATDARNHTLYRSYHPYWYEVTLARDGEVYTGYVSEEFIQRGASQVLSVGGTFWLSPVLMPADSDDVVRYLSENSTVATVSQDGTVTATGAGVVNIVGYTSTGALDCIRLTVTE